MCGIHFCLGESKEHNAKLLQKRGPDKTNYLYFKGAHCTFYRLAIVGLDHGDQPFHSKPVPGSSAEGPKGNKFNECMTMANGEIYNHKLLNFQLRPAPGASSEGLQLIDGEFYKLGSDCEIIHLLFRLGWSAAKICGVLDGEWAFVHFNGDEVFFARDRLGRKPLYYLAGSNCLAISSTIEGLTGYLSGHPERKIVECLPGVLYFASLSKEKPLGQAIAPIVTLGSVPYHDFLISTCSREVNDLVPNPFSYSDFYKLFVSAVARRVNQSDRPVGFLLSGGFDSSLVLSVALQWCKFKTPPHVFTFGFEEKAPDVLAAEKVVNYLREIHGPNCIEWHKVIGNIDDGLQAIREVIASIETCDITTVRASTPMFLISKYIAEKTNVKVILSGEGSDELFGGYLYFMYAPSNIAFQSEILKLLRELYQFDVRRADRTTAAHGLEIRTPFLDDDFVRYFLNHGMCGKNNKISKEFIRDVISKCAPAILPEDIIQGKKEAFSDAVGYSWKDSIDGFAKKELASMALQHRPDQSSEAFFYQTVFEKCFGIPKEVVLSHYWLPNKNWVDTGNEPSARALGVYTQKN